MAGYNDIKGYTSETIVEMTLSALGWEVARPVLIESYDLVARRPGEEGFVRLQVKTVRRRVDRNNEMVIYARRKKGTPYTTADCDYIVGVEGSTFYLIPCAGITEYWATDARAAQIWERYDLTTVPFNAPTGS